MFGISCTGRDKSDINQTKIYYDTCEKIFKERYNNHIPLFLEIKVKNSTELSKYICKLKIGSIDYDLKWSITCKAQPYTSGTRKCDLYLTELYFCFIVQIKFVL